MGKQGRGATGKQTLMDYRSAILLGCTALIACMPGMTLAQDAASASAADSTVLETITVQGQGDDDSKTIVATQSTGSGKMPTEILETPASVSVVTSKEVEERGADSIEQVLQYTSAVVTDFYGSDDRYDYFKIRGFYPYTYRDGLPLGRSWGGVLEEPYAFDRVEVLKGASSTGFGVSDPGGAVNYVTKTPKSGKFGEAYVTGGSFDHAETGFDFGDNITEDDTLSYRLTGKFQRSHDEYDYSQDDENFIMGGVTWRPTDQTSLSFVFDHLDKDGTPSSGGHPLGSDFDRDRFFGEPDFNYNTVNRNTYTVLFDHDFGNGLSLGSSARYSKANTGFGYAYINDDQGVYDTSDTSVNRDFFAASGSSERFVFDTHMIYEANFDQVESRTMVGAEYARIRTEDANYYDSSSPYLPYWPGLTTPIDWENPVYTGALASLPLLSNTKAKQNTKALYLQQDMTFFDRLTATVGLRNDWLDLNETDLTTGVSNAADYSEFSKRVGLSYKITNELAAYVSYAESVAPPSTGTEPTTGTQYEVGIKYMPEAFPAVFTASIYDLTMENITTYDAPTYLPATVDKIRHRGLDLEAKAEVTDNINVIAAYSYIDSEIIEPGGDYDGKRFSQVPEHMASLWGTYTLAGNGLRGDATFGLGARYVGSYYFNNANTMKSGGAVLFDAAFTYQIQENTSLQVNVSNIFNEKHVAQNDGGAIYYNPARTIYATLRQTW